MTDQNRSTIPYAAVVSTVLSTVAIPYAAVVSTVVRMVAISDAWS